MRQFMMTVTALTAFGALVATAQAEILNGAPMRKEINASSIPPVMAMMAGLVAGARVRNRRAQAQLRQLQHLDPLVAARLRRDNGSLSSA
jgi:hypothetical protein